MAIIDLQGKVTELIEENREPYTTALREADRAWANNTLDLTAMEKLLSELLATQLVFLHEAATGIRYLPPPPFEGA
jgi:hypothetical protein